MSAYLNEDLGSSLPEPVCRSTSIALRSLLLKQQFDFYSNGRQCYVKTFDASNHRPELAPAI